MFNQIMYKCMKLLNLYRFIFDRFVPIEKGKAKQKEVKRKEKRPDQKTEKQVKQINGDANICFD